MSFIFFQVNIFIPFIFIPSHAKGHLHRHCHLCARVVFPLIRSSFWQVLFVICIQVHPPTPFPLSGPITHVKNNTENEVGNFSIEKPTSFLPSSTLHYVNRESSVRRKKDCLSASGFISNNEMHPLLSSSFSSSLFLSSSFCILPL